MISGSVVFIYAAQSPVDAGIQAGRKRQAGQSSCQSRTCSGATARKHQRSVQATEWMLATHKQDLSPEEIRKEAQTFFTQMAKK